MDLKTTHLFFNDLLQNFSLEILDFAQTKTFSLHIILVFWSNIQQLAKNCTVNNCTLRKQYHETAHSRMTIQVGGWFFAGKLLWVTVLQRLLTEDRFFFSLTAIRSRCLRWEKAWNGEGKLHFENFTYFVFWVFSACQNECLFLGWEVVFGGVEWCFEVG